MKESPKSVCPHIVIVGRRNVGKSSLLNAICGQELAIVSAKPGTTTDPVEKKMELLPYGPVVFIDTAGLDDEGETGKLRIRRSEEMLGRADIAILVTDSLEWGQEEEKLLEKIREYETGCLVALNIKDKELDTSQLSKSEFPSFIPVSPHKGAGMDELRTALLNELERQKEEDDKKIFADLLQGEGPVLLVVPLDSGAPKGRLILPQAQTIRECLDESRACMLINEKQLDNFNHYLAVPPVLVICDSQVVQKAAQKIPANIPLTTFSILMARMKGDLEQFARGAGKLSKLGKGDRVLIMEACTHHPQKDDIGRVKIPVLLRKMTGTDLDIHFHAGRNMPEKADWDLVIHCGACMLTNRQMKKRQAWARQNNIPMTNYGMTISKAQGVLERSMGIFPELLAKMQ